jgi:rhomboid protease GluP
MNLNHLIIWTVCLSCGLTIVRTVGSSDRRGWMVVSTAILMAIAAMLYFAPQWASLVGGVLWLILLVLPGSLMHWTIRLVYQQRYHQARKLSEIVRWLHPADGLALYPKLLRSLEMAQSGNMEAARAILDQHQDIETPHGRYATFMLYRMDSQWYELLAWMRDRIPEKLLLKDRDLIMNYLRALGETGDLNGLVQGLEKFERTINQTGSVDLNTMRMMTLAFCGEIDSLKLLFANQLKMYSSEISQFWIATAEMTAGMELEARQRLESLNHSKDISLQKAIAWRLSHTDGDRKLTDASKQILAQIKTDIQQEERYGGAIKLTGKKAYATYALIGLNLLVFALEIALGGSENSEILYRMGGLLPTSVWQGEWWRLLNATFLHINLLHLSLNMVGLYVLGEFVEVRLGIRKYLIAYFFSGIGSMLSITIFTVVFNLPVRLTVGASGAIMGIIGATGAILLKGWLVEKSRIAAKRLRTVLFMIGFQVVFDLNTPQVSSLGHASGLVLGFLISLFLVPNSKHSN